MPVGTGFVDSLAPPGGKATGFTSYEYSMSAKWLELLKEIAPGVKTGGSSHIRRDRSVRLVQTAAPSLGVELTPINMRNATEIEQSVTAFVRSGNGGLIVTPSASVLAHRNLIITLAARHYLFHPGEPIAHLSLNQGTTAVREEFGGRARQVLMDRAEFMRKLCLTLPRCFPVGSIDLGSDARLPGDFAAGHALGVTYTFKNLPGDHLRCF